MHGLDFWFYNTPASVMQHTGITEHHVMASGVMAHLQEFLAVHQNGR